MPSAENHLKQYKSNKELLKDIVFDIANTKYSDWLITIIFYSAIHLVEKELAESNIDSKNHDIRDSNIVNNEKLKFISHHFVALRNQSQLARYKCTKFNKRDIEQAYRSLYQIEKVVVNL